MDIKKPWYQSFSWCNPPYLRLWKTPAYLFNKLRSACMSHPPQDHFDPATPATAMLPKAVFSFPAAHLPTATFHAPSAGEKQTQSSRAPILLQVPPAGKQRPAEGNFLCESISPTGTDFFFLFLKCKLGKLGRTSVFIGMKAQKATTVPAWCKETVWK